MKWLKRNGFKFKVKEAPGCHNTLQLWECRNYFRVAAKEDSLRNDKESWDDMINKAYADKVIKIMSR